MTLESLLSKIENTRQVTTDQCLAIRGIVFGKGAIRRSHADTLFRINEMIKDTPTEWSDVFMEAQTDYLVRQTRPFGYVDANEAKWFIGQLAFDGRIESLTELRTLVNVIKTADHVHDSLSIFALDTVKTAILNGEGLIGRSRTLGNGVIGASDVDVLKTILYSVSSMGQCGISRLEAEFLFDLADRVTTQDGDDSFETLFVGAIANHLMSLMIYNGLECEQALKKENWLMSDKTMWATALSGGSSGEGYGKTKRRKSVLMHWLQSMRPYKTSDKATLSLDDKSALAQAEIIDKNEADWIIERLNRDEKLSPMERALLEFLDKECPNVHTALVRYKLAA